MQRRSPEWYAARKGKPTASEISRVLGKAGLAKTRDAIENYAFEKAVEIVYGIHDENDFTPFDVARGLALEPIAFEKFREMKALEFIDVKEASFFPYGSDAGASPDGIVGTDACLEIKCPRPNKFFKLVALGEKAIDSEYIAQMQMQMLATNSKQCYFFNYIIFKGREMWHEIIVKRDDDMIELIKERIEQVVNLRNEFVQYLLENQQFETVTI